MKPVKISHVGIAVRDLEGALADYRALFDFEQIEITEVKSEGVRIAMLKVGESEIELLSPIKSEGNGAERGPIEKFLQEKGEGVHHIAIKVADVAEAISRAGQVGLKVLDKSPRSAANGAEAAFVHPKSMHGVLLEFYNR